MGDNFEASLLEEGVEKSVVAVLKGNLHFNYIIK